MHAAAERTKSLAAGIPIEHAKKEKGRCHRVYSAAAPFNLSAANLLAGVAAGAGRPFGGLALLPLLALLLHGAGFGARAAARGVLSKHSGTGEKRQAE